MNTTRRYKTRVTRLLMSALCVLLVGALLFLSVAPVFATTYTVNFDGGYAYTLLSGTLTGSGGNPNGYILSSTTTTNSCGTSIASVDVYALITLSAGEYVSGVSIDVKSNANAGWTILLYNGASVIYSVSANHNGGWTTVSSGALNFSNVTKVYVENYTCGVVGINTSLDNIVISTAFTPTLSPTVTSTGTITPTLSPTLTPSLTPQGDSGALYQPCIPMKASNGSKWILYEDAELVGQNYLYLPPGATASTQLILAINRQYEIDLDYSGSLPEVNQSFSLLLGTSVQSISIPSDLLIHNDTLPAANYPPNAEGGWSLSVHRLSTDVGPFTLYRVCVREVSGSTVGVGGGGDNGPSNDVCTECSPPQEGFDPQGIIGWLFCNFRRFITCTLGGQVQGVWGWIGRVLMILISFIRWIFGTAGSGTSWIQSLLGSFFGVAAGTTNNAIGQVIDSLVNGPAGQVSHQVAAVIRDAPIYISNSISSLVAQLRPFSGNVLSDIGAFLHDIWILVQVVAAAIGLLLQLLPILLNALLTGFNASSITISGSPICSNPSNLLYYPCYGFYVLDNTIFQGPARFLTPFALGLLSLDTIIWIVSKFKEDFGGPKS